MSPASHRNLRRALLLAVLIVGGAWTPVWAQLTDPAGRALLELEATVGGPVQATVSPVSGLATFVRFSAGREARVPGVVGEPADQRARAFVDRHGALFGLATSEQLSLTRASGLDEVGMEHVRFRQTHRGVPLTGGEITVHLRGAAVVAVNARTLAGLEGLEVVPAVGPEVAEATTWEFLSRRLGVSDADLSAPRLELFNRGLLEGREGPTRLTWFVEASAMDLRQFIWVDAASGAALFHFSQLTETLDRGIYDADDPGDAVYNDLPGTLVRVEGGPATGDSDADDAYDFSGDTYDYFFNEHGRDSYDDAGASLISSVHFCPSAGSCPYANAFWNGTQMAYGDGFPAADDVDAHELTHAVTEFTANLFYYMQSGALNESYSDIFGETVDQTNTGGTDTPAVKWKMGEDVPGFGAIRDMMDPTLFGDPGKMSDPQFDCGDPGSDAGGVHTNSGIPNHAYALMVDGGTYNGETVSALGFTKAGKIQYRALAHYLVSSSDFLDNYNALLQSCEDLIGTAGITAADCGEVEDALDAVEMAAGWPCSPAAAAVPDLCPPGEAPELWFTQDMEASGLPACPSDVLPTTWCANGPSSFLGANATSGIGSAWAYNEPIAALDTMTLGLSGSALPADARLQFNHSHGFENTGTSYWDGGIVEYSTDDGASWLDAGPLITAGQAYGGVIDACCSNPLTGSSAFVGDSWGFTASQVDLSSFAGATMFDFSFSVGTDTLFDDYGWWIDDVRIYTCASCVADRVLDATYTGLASSYDASGSITAGTGFEVGPFVEVAFEAPVVKLTDDFIGVGDLAIVNAGCP